MQADNRVGFFLPSLRLGGTERITVNLVESFVERGVEVEVILANAVGPLMAFLPSSAKVTNLHHNSVLRAIPALTRYLNQSRIPVLLSLMDHANVAALAAKRLSRSQTKVVVSVRSTVSLNTRGSTRVLDKLIPTMITLGYPFADGIIAVSNGVADDLARITGIAKERIHVLYNPVVTPSMLAAGKTRPEHPWFRAGEPQVLISVGRLAREKDHATLIRAFATVQKRKHVRLMILGEGKERLPLQGLAEALGVSDDVSFPGAIENPYPYIASSALFVLSSIWEGFPNVLVEAMACGTPVISTDCPNGPSEILENGRYGALVPVGNPDALARAILAGLDRPRNADVLLTRASNFDVNKIAPAYLEFLSGIVHRVAVA